MVDIFKEGTKSEMSWFTAKNIGDKVQGTYIDRLEGEDQWNNPQFMYVLKTEDGSLVQVAVKKTKTPLLKQMEGVKFGQIIGFVYSKDLAPKPGKGTNPIKIIDLIQNPSIVDEQWLAAQKKLAGISMPLSSTTTEPVAEKVVEPIPNTIEGVWGKDEVEAVKVMTDADKINIIADIAKTKLGVTDAAQVKDKVMEATMLAFIPANLDKIIEKLETLK